MPEVTFLDLSNESGTLDTLSYDFINEARGCHFVGIFEARSVYRLPHHELLRYHVHADADLVQVVLGVHGRHDSREASATAKIAQPGRHCVRTIQANSERSRT